MTKLNNIAPFWSRIVSLRWKILDRNASTILWRTIDSWVSRKKFLDTFKACITSFCRLILNSTPEVSQDVLFSSKNAQAIFLFFFCLKSYGHILLFFSFVWNCMTIFLSIFLTFFYIAINIWYSVKCEKWTDKNTLFLFSCFPSCCKSNLRV